MDRLDALTAAERFVAERFPNAAASFLGGSVLTPRCTPTSDLDVVVVVDGPPAPYRETLRAHGWVVELFAHTPTSLRHYWDKDAAKRRTPLLRMCAEGHVLSSRGASAATIQDEARSRLTAGPPPPEAEQLAWKRYALTDLLNDFRGCTDPAETSYISSALLLAASELALLAASRWLAGGKWLGRRLAELDAELATQLVTAHREAVSGVGRRPLEVAVLEVLDRAGGPLMEGYRVGGEDPAQEAAARR